MLQLDQVPLTALYRICRGRGTAVDWHTFRAACPGVLEEPETLKKLYVRAMVFQLKNVKTVGRGKWELINEWMTWSETPEGVYFWQDILFLGVAGEGERSEIQTNTHLALRRTLLKPRLSPFPECCAGTVVGRVGFDDPDGVHKDMIWDDLVQYHKKDLGIVGRAFQVMVLHERQIEAMKADGHKPEELGYKAVTDWLPNRKGESVLKMFVRVPS